MRFDGREVRTRGDDWIEVQTEDGRAVLRGYDPALVEYETLDEAKDEKRDELVLSADAAYRAIFTRDGAYVELEKDYIMWRKMFGLALSPLQTSQVTQAQAVIEKLQARLAAVNQIVQGPNETVEDAVARMRAIQW